MSKKQDTYLAVRDKSVVKANELIQKSRFSLTTQQQKMVLYLISQITPFDKEFKTYEFNIYEFCRVCGINTSGQNYNELKEQIKRISDKSIWISDPEDPDGWEALVRWIEMPQFSAKSGIVRIRLNEHMKPYLLQLKENFTKYGLVYTLMMKSKYSIRLYELMKSIHFHELEEYTRRYTLDELRRALDAETYKVFKDFRHRALDPAVKEINEYTDMAVAYETVLEGRKAVGIEFTIKTKDAMDRLKVRDMIDKALGTDQLTLWDEIREREAGAL